MNNKAVKAAIKKGCKLFPEFDMQGFRLICKICNIPMEITEDTRLIDLEAHTKSAEHISCMGSDKSRMTRAKAQRNRLNMSDKSFNQSQNGSPDKPGTSSNSPATSLSKPISSPPSTTSSSSSSSYNTSCSTTPKPIKPNPKHQKGRKTFIVQRDTDRQIKPNQDKVIVINDDTTQDSVYLSDFSDDLDPDRLPSFDAKLKANDSGKTNNNTYPDKQTTNRKQSSQDGVDQNKSLESTSLDATLTNKPSETDVPSTIPTVPQGDPVRDDSQVEKSSESQSDQQPSKPQPEQSQPPLNPQPDAKVNPKDDFKSDSNSDPISSDDKQNFDKEVNCNQKNSVIPQEPTVNGKSESPAPTSTELSDSLILALNCPPIITTTTSPLAITYPSTNKDVTSLVTSNAEVDKNDYIEGDDDDDDDDDDNIMSISDDFSHQNASTSKIISSEQSDRLGARARLRKRKLSPIKNGIETPIKTMKSKGSKRSLGVSILDDDDDSKSKFKSSRKRGRKKKSIPIIHDELSSSVDDSNASSITSITPTTTTSAPNNNVKLIPTRRKSTSSVEFNSGCTEFVIPSNTVTNFDLTILTQPEEIPKSSSPSKETVVSPQKQPVVMSSPKTVLMITNQDSQKESTNADQPNYANKEQSSDLGGNNNNAITIISSKINNSRGQINGYVKQEIEEIYCEHENIQQVTLIKPEPISEYQPDKEELYADYINLCLDASLSFIKLTGPLCRTFFLKHFGLSIPNADLMKTHVLQPIQESKMNSLKRLVADHNIYLIIKSHQNEEKGHVLTIMVGVLNGQPTRSHLYKISILQEFDLTILSREILTTLHNLYQGLVFDKLSLLVTDDSPLMGKIGNFLKTLYPKLRHIPCFYQVCDNICESFRQGHPLMQLYVNTVNNFFITSKFLNKYKQLTTKKRQIPVPPSKLYGYNWMQVADDFFAETTLISETIAQELDEVTKENFLGKIHDQLDNKDLHMEWIDFNGYNCIRTAIELMQSNSLNLTQMKEIIVKLGRIPRRSSILTQITKLIESNPDLAELLTIAEDIKDERKNVNCKHFNYSPISTLDSFNCYDIFKSILSENGSSLGDTELEMLTFLAYNKNL